MNVEQLPLGPLGTNCYIIEQEKKALIIDPGSEGEKLIRMIERREISPVAILLTHAHFDHIGAVDEVRDHFSIPVYVHKEEEDWLGKPELNGSKFFQMGQVTARDADHLIELGTINMDGFTFEVRHTPGHSPGSVSFWFKEQSFVIAGDTLFQGGIGRTDLPGGDMKTLQESIEDQLLSLGDDTKVYPGHGGRTTVGEEKVMNPFL
ncbi:MULTISPECIES: MBL fold metallo-hydrolase [Pontibacillus]|uniref:MBL fold metallo-hydrolase n=1 Tax=Pontibacillus chungwhensis TaxID=265426 RepID=A0ABY8UWN5_9BACI|nr:MULTISPECIES: MBL fold metallo-hydrolase [Pontibacillus]MCD5323560.1 MBL fold metallo-hydrolase [Pontibacillus sp. HN14]WIF96929.1 MBL fold metallo-hydrolase [Pontibacillus chungwhensis]